MFGNIRVYERKDESRETTHTEYEGPTSEALIAPPLRTPNGIFCNLALLIGTTEEMEVRVVGWSGVMSVCVGRGRREGGREGGELRGSR